MSRACRCRPPARTRLLPRTFGTAPVAACATGRTPGSGTSTGPRLLWPARSRRCRRQVLAAAGTPPSRSQLARSVDEGAAEWTSTRGDEGGLRTCNLPVLGIASQLQHGLVVMVHAVDVALGQQAAMRIDHHIPAIARATGAEVVTDLALLA